MKKFSKKEQEIFNQLFGENMNSKKTNDFESGKRDCEKGVIHESGKSKEYDSGYSRQYETEARASHE